MRTKHLLPLLVLLLTTLSTHAYDFKSGDLYYNITSDTTVEVTYKVKGGFLHTPQNNQCITTAIIPTTVTYKRKIFSVTRIGSSAFRGCSSLTSITIPESVTSIGINAFCECSSLTSITIPSSVTSIEVAAFYGCSALPVVDNLRYADTYLVEAVDKSLSTYTIKAGTKWIGHFAFSSCPTLTSITIPNSVTSIGDCAFSSCPALTSITIPNSVTSIGDLAFCECSSLTSITIPNSVTSIGVAAFAASSSLTSITIPNSVTSIGNSAFYRCSSLTSITIPESVTSIGINAFCECSSLTSITIPSSVTSIGVAAFYGCSALTSLTIPNSVKRIGKDAFSLVANIVYMGKDYGPSRGARSVNGYVEGDLVYANEKKKKLLACNKAATGELTIPNSVTSIGEWAFEGCSALTSVTIPKSVRKIGSFAFNGCSGVVDVYCYATIPPDGFSSSVSSGVSKNCNLHVPKGSILLYRIFGSWDRSYIFKIAEE